MERSVIVVDDFLEQPDLLRAAALKQEYPRLQNTPYFPGRNSKYPQPINGWTERIEALVGQRLTPVKENAPFAHFRLALDGDMGTKGVHVDKADWTCILYLTLPEHCQDGTHLFRHIATDSDRAPLTIEQCNEMGCKDFPEYWDKILNADTNDRSKWELTMTIPMRYNRLVIIRPHQYHDAGLSFGDSVENGRLIYLSGFMNAY